MIFSSLLFLSIFLVAVLALYYIIPNRTYRNIVLCIASLFFYAWGEPVCVILMIFSILMNYTAGLVMGRCRRRGSNGGARAALIIAVFFNLLMLGVFKYTPLVFDTLKSFIPSLQNTPAPIAKDILYKSLGGLIPALKNFRVHPNADFRETVNTALNATLTRTVNTSVSTLLPMLAIAIWGGESIRGLAVALCLGVIIGTYASIMIGTPIMYDATMKGASGKAVETKTSKKK